MLLGACKPHTYAPAEQDPAMPTSRHLYCLRDTVHHALAMLTLVQQVTKIGGESA